MCEDERPFDLSAGGLFAFVGKAVDAGIDALYSAAGEQRNPGDAFDLLLMDTGIGAFTDAAVGAKYAVQSVRASSRAAAALDAVDASTVRFTQDSIGRSFSSGQTLKATVEGLKDGSISPDAFPPIRVFEHIASGLTFTLDNRRLFVFQQAGMAIRTVLATAAEVTNEGWKFTTRNEGASIRVRGGL